MFRPMPWKTAAVLVGAASALAAALTVGVSPAQASAGQAYLEPGQSLQAGQELDAGSYKLQMRADGDLVLLKNSTICWTSATATTTNHPEAVMQTDTNFVVYSKAHGTPLWATGKVGGSGVILALNKSGGQVYMQTADQAFIPKKLKDAHC